LEDWKFAQAHRSQQLARLHQFSVMKRQGEKDIEFQITIREYANPADPPMAFFAQADKETNQKSAPYRPHGWGGSMLDALAACIREIERFPYEG